MLKKLSLVVVAVLAAAQTVTAGYCNENKVRCHSVGADIHDSEACNIRYMACLGSMVWVPHCVETLPTPPPLPPVKVKTMVKQDPLAIDDCYTYYYTCDEKAVTPEDTNNCNLRLTACERGTYHQWVPLCVAPMGPTPIYPEDPAPAPAQTIKVHKRKHHHHKEQ
jgi:hypothetical protein